MPVEKEDQIEYWKATALHDLPVIDDLFKAARYDWALFIGHLALEKVMNTPRSKLRGIEDKE